MRQPDRSFTFKSVMGKVTTVDRVLQVNFEPNHVVFVGAGGVIILAELAVNVQGLKETTSDSDV